MKDRILKAISRCSACSFSDIEYAYESLKSFDLVIESIGMAGARGISLSSACGVIEALDTFKEEG